MTIIYIQRVYVACNAGIVTACIAHEYHSVPC